MTGYVLLILALQQKSKHTTFNIGPHNCHKFNLMMISTAFFWPSSICFMCYDEFSTFSFTRHPDISWALPSSLYTLYSFLTIPQHKLTTPSSSYQERRRKSTTPFSFSQAPNMELAPSFFNGSWKRYWRRKRYQRLDGAITARKNTNVARFGGSPRRTWKIKAVPKLRILKNIASPTKLLRKLKNAYISMILSVAGNADGTHVFGDKRVPRGRQVKAAYPSEAFEKRLVYEIYKNLLATRELSTM